MGPYVAFATAGFQRWSTYRLATAAGALTNTVFGLVKAAVMLAAVGAAGGSIAGYDGAQAVTFAWISQALLAPVNVFGGDDLAQRVRSGDIAVDLARPVDLQLSAWASDLGRATYLLLPRGLPPLLVGALVTGVALPAAPEPYLVGLLSLFAGVSLSFACQWVVNLTSFWLLDVRGALMVYTVVAMVLSGLSLPVHWFPDWMATVAAATPFPSMLQTPVDVVTGRVVGEAALQALGTQACWLAVTLLLGRVVLRLGTRTLIVQGG